MCLYCMFKIWIIIFTLMENGTSTYLYEDCIDHIGKEFLLLFLENHRTGLDPQLYITTPLDKEVTVRIQTPSWSSSDNVDITVNVNKTNATVVNLPESLRLKDSSKEKKGIRVTSSDVIVLYGGNIQDNSGDSTIVYPIEVLGKDYIDVIFDQIDTKYDSTLGVVALHNDTRVMVDLLSGVSVTFGGVIHTGDEFKILLNEYETFQLMSQDLSGTFLTASNVIAVYSGYTFIRIGSSTTKDYIETMLPPVSSLSHSYFLINNPLHKKSEFARVVNPYSQTTVSFISPSAGNQDVVLNARGSHADFIVPMTGGAKITANRPILVVQLSQGRSMGSKGDPRIMVALSEDSFLSEYTFTTPAIIGSKPYIHGMVILCENSHKEHLRLDGVSLSSLGVTWIAMDSGDFSYTHTSLSFGAHRLTSSVLHTRFSGYVFGYGSTEEYGTGIGRYFQDTNEVGPNEVSMPTDEKFQLLCANCIGDKARLRQRSRQCNRLKFRIGRLIRGCACIIDIEAKDVLMKLLIYNEICCRVRCEIDQFQTGLPSDFQCLLSFSQNRIIYTAQYSPNDQTTESR